MKYFILIYSPWSWRLVLGLFIYYILIVLILNDIFPAAAHRLQSPPAFQKDKDNTEQILDIAFTFPLLGRDSRGIGRHFFFIYAYNKPIYQP